MKKRLLYSLIIFILFLMPFLILSNHFINTVDEININNTLLVMDMSVSSLSYQITDTLVQNYDVMKNIRNKNYDSVTLRKKLSEIKSNSVVVKNISVYNSKGFVEFSTDKNSADVSVDKNILESARKFKIPVGKVIYPKDAPPELLTAEYIGDRLFVSVTDLGYLNGMLLKTTKKLYGKLYLSDGVDNIIFDSNYDYLFNYDIKPAKEVSGLISNLVSKNVFGYKGSIYINGRKSLISIYNVETTKWWIYCVTDYNKVINNNLRIWARRVVYSGIMLIFIFSYISVILMEKFYFNNHIKKLDE